MELKLKVTDTHIYFWGGIYSQWAKVKFNDGEKEFSSAEQYMMYRKAVTFNDLEAAEKIMKTNDPKKQKAIGRTVKNFDPDVWSNMSLAVVTLGNFFKFSQNPKLYKELLATGDKTIVEGSPYDKIWGVGLAWDDPKILDEANWDGQNLLGIAIMETRFLLREVA